LRWLTEGIFAWYSPQDKAYSLWSRKIQVVQYNDSESHIK